MSKCLIEKYRINFKEIDIYKKIQEYFNYFDKMDTYLHSLDVVEQVKKLNNKFDFNLEKCVLAAYMHDLGRVVIKDEIVQFCDENKHKFLEGEKLAPAILHQIASRIIAEHIFNIKDHEVLEALECHTTLRSHPSEIDIIVFLADKLSWKEEEYQEMIDCLNESLNESQEKAVYIYLEDIFNKRDLLKCYHQWAKEAYEYFKTLMI